MFKILENLRDHSIYYASVQLNNSPSSSNLWNSLSKDSFCVLVLCTSSCILSFLRYHEKYFFFGCCYNELFLNVLKKKGCKV
ncbi:hypothetical protein BpHYR1_051124 [Brachionus plicatilis]|uniref:Uncharacterized protein n=1 Tax=Brachionus plicatilis TaxID=10195 RepID=A0A3M7Q0J0_BRAPC|nr:hypothetical protein BpHYR1_051124 [Brachionus plicatilis]